MPNNPWLSCGQKTFTQTSYGSKYIKKCHNIYGSMQEHDLIAAFLHRITCINKYNIK